MSETLFTGASGGAEPAGGGGGSIGGGDGNDPSGSVPSDGAPSGGGVPNAVPTGEPNAPFSFASLLNDQGAFREDMGSHLPAELQEHAATLSRYKTPEAMMQGLVHAKSLVGKKQEPIQAPGADATPEQVAEYRQQMGLPADPYALKLPENAPEAVRSVWGDEQAAQLDQFGKWAHEQHFTPGQVEALTGWYLQNEASNLAVNGQRSVEMEEQYLAEQQATLTQRFGEDTPKITNDVYNAGMRVLTNTELMGGNVMSVEDAKATMSNPGFREAGVIEVLAGVVRAAGADKFVEGRSTFDDNSLSVIESKLQDANDPSTPFGKRIANKDEAAIAERSKLFQQKAKLAGR